MASTAPTGATEQTIAGVRAFNRFYTTIIGALRGEHLSTPYSLTEARVIFELAQQDATPAAELRARLDIDGGQLSRVLGRLEEAGLLTKHRSPGDGRQQVTRLTELGRSAFADLDSRAVEQVRRLLAPLTAEDRQRLGAAMATIQQILGEQPAPSRVVLRSPEPGDLGWVVARHGALYAEEFGWDETFEALVTRIVADYAQDHDPRRERAWVAEVDGERAGSVFCVHGGAGTGADTESRESTRGGVEGHDTAKLRLLLTEPRFRGKGAGSALVDECVRFARRAGYARLDLWTNDVLVQARRLYERAGFALVRQERHHSFGSDLVGQYWSLRL